ncbi:MAG: 4-alpha-glucanotransferase, partial [Deltaproteobacteria bacterium]
HPETRARIQRLREEEHVNYELVATLKLEILKEVFRTFLKNHGDPRKQSSRWSDFQAYVDSEGTYLERFATFCALEEHFLLADPSMESWRDWPAGLRDPSSEEVRKFRRENENAVLFWMYLQWQIDEQLSSAHRYAIKKGMVLGLYHDEALAVDPSGADFWAMQKLFHEGFTIGAPPDAFAPEGQDWGFAPPNREEIRNSGYEPFLKKLSASCKDGGALRIDHVMQLHRLYWIPESRKPSDGVYVRDFEDDLLNLLALASQRTGTVIVGEDLGTVPMEFRERLMARGVFSYRLFYFEQDGHGNLVPHYDYPESALASITTHDLPTLAGFWSNRDIDVRCQIGQLDEQQGKRFREDRILHKTRIVERLVQDGFLSSREAQAARSSQFLTEALHSAVLAFLFHTPSKLVLVNQEDVFQDERQQNIPGTVTEHANWVTKMSYTVEELRAHPNALRMTQKFKNLLQQSGRSPRRD